LSPADKLRSLLTFADSGAWNVAQFTLPSILHANNVEKSILNKTDSLIEFLSLCEEKFLSAHRTLKTTVRFCVLYRMHRNMHENALESKTWVKTNFCA
jgi:hypothetical protein